MQSASCIVHSQKRNPVNSSLGVVEFMKINTSCDHHDQEQHL